MKNKVNETPSDKKEEPNINPSIQETVGSKAPASDEANNTPRQRKTLGGAKSEEERKESKIKSAKKDKKPSKSTTALKVVLAVLLFSVIALASIFLYFFINSDNKKEETSVIIDTTASVVKPQVQQPDNTQSLESQAKSSTEVGLSVEGQQPQVNTDKTDTNTIATVDQAGTALPSVSQDTNDKAIVAEVSKPKPEPKSLTANMPDPEEIINAEVPQDESLVKEEIDKLSDEEQRLEQQEKLLDKRLKMMDELTAKKQEQIELLEKQIAQIEEKQKTDK